MKPAVKKLLRQIEALSDRDRMELDLELSRRQNEEWRKETKKARTIARKRGITLDVIDRIIERRRYGK